MELCNQHLGLRSWGMQTVPKRSFLEASIGNVRLLLFVSLLPLGYKTHEGQEFMTAIPAKVIHGRSCFVLFETDLYVRVKHRSALMWLVIVATHFRGFQPHKAQAIRSNVCILNPPQRITTILK
jgi:hypothetical protein